MNSDPLASRDLVGQQAGVSRGLVGSRPGSVDGIARSLSLADDPSGDSAESSTDQELPQGVASRVETGEAESSTPEVVRVEPDLENGGSITHYEDGTRVREYTNDGVAYTETQSSTNGDSTTEVNYSQNGADHTELVTEYGDGRVVTDTQVDQNGVVTQTVSETNTSADPIEDLGNFAGTLPPPEGDRQPTQVTTTSQQVIDNTVEPPTVRLVSESTNITQFQPLPEDQIGEGDHQTTVLLSPGVSQNEPPFGNDHSGTLAIDRPVSIDRDQTGHHLSYTEVTTYDENGEPTTANTSSYEQRVAGVDAEGREVVASETTVYTGDYANATGSEDSPFPQVHTISERRGVYPREDVLNDRNIESQFLGPGAVTNTNELAAYPEFAAQLGNSQDPYLDIRVTTASGASGDITSIDYGDYSNPTQDGTSINIQASTSGGRSVTYQEVSNNGRAIDQQTVIPGTEISTTSQTRYQDDGSYTVDNLVTDGGATVREEHITGSEVTFSGVSQSIDSEGRDAFQAASNGRPIFEEQVQIVDHANGSREESNSTVYTSNGATLGQVTTPDGNQLSLFEGSGGEILLADGNGHRIETNSQGQFEYDGQVLTSQGEPLSIESDPLSVPGSLTRPRSFASSLNKIFKYTAANGGLDNPFPAGFQNSISVAGAAFGLINIGGDLAQGHFGDAVDSFGSAADSLSSTARLVSQSAAPGSRLGSTAAVLGRYLTGAGVVANVGLAIDDFFGEEKDLEGGAIHTATAVGLALTLNPATAPLGGVVLAASSLYSLADYVQDATNIDYSTASFAF